jgi:hypothetical protein
MRRTLPLIACLLVLAAAPAAAHAGWFVADPIDGPGDIERVAVDFSRQGAANVLYVKRDAAGARVWHSGLVGGAWVAPAPASGPGATDAVVASGEDGRVAGAWVENGIVFGSLLGKVTTQLSGGGGASGLSIDLGVNGDAYAVWSQNGDVRAARLKGETWETVPLPLDVDPSKAAGEGASRPRVVVAADGSALVVWGEAHADGTTHVYARRIYGMTLSALPQDATLATVPGQLAGSADSPDVDVEFDRSYAWVVFRQDFGGRTRTIARRLRASTFEPPAVLDGDGEGTDPHVSISGGGDGFAVSAGSGASVIGTPVTDDGPLPSGRVDTLGGASNPVVAFSDRSDSAVAWLSGAEARGRLAPADSPFGPEAVLSRPELGAVVPGSLAASADRVGNVAVAMLQGAPGARHVTVALHDLPPSRPVVTGVRKYSPRRPLVRWTPGLDFVGPQTYRVLVDGREAGTTRRTKLRLPPQRRGRHRIQVVGIDQRGQAAPSRVKPTLVDPKRPKARVGTMRSGRTVRLSVRARDGRRGTGIDRIRTDWGDGRKDSWGASPVHRYRRGGRFTITIRVRDRAGNVTVKRTTVRV